ncbi:hypothetical protein E2C01_048546 [Portunus trituberculatus]|uniref:Uncharacterized protein n=1 Tax=Portunus trituberculatus TaxID=210409 RepID=A0A5B7GBF6_PORTR|nr:hypothetical protein [Portunus trituberculatus]
MQRQQQIGQRERLRPNSALLLQLLDAPAVYCCGLLYLRPRPRWRLVNSDRVVIYQPQHYISFLYCTAVTNSTGKLRLLNSHPGGREGCGRRGGREDTRAHPAPRPSQGYITLH